MLSGNEIGIILCLIVLLILGGVILFRFKKKSKVTGTCPPEVLAEFERAEQLSKEYKGSVTPQAILWQINEERNKLHTFKPDDYRDKLSLERQQVPQTQEQFKPKTNLSNIFKRPSTNNSQGGVQKW